MVSCNDEIILPSAVDPILEKHLGVWQYEANLRGKQWNPRNLELVIVFTTEEPGGMHMATSKVFNGWTLIEVYKPWYDSALEESQEFVLFHEFGHALLGYMENQPGIRIMARGGIHLATYPWLRNGMIDEIF